MWKKQEETEQKAKENNEDGRYNKKSAVFEENINKRTVFALEQRAVRRHGNEKNESRRKSASRLGVVFIKNRSEEVEES